jgi:ferredoxin-NADP reductase
MVQKVRILDAENVTHDVRRFRFEKPSGYDFTPGQATDVSIDKDGWREKKSPVTFTILPHADHLEFTIKIYSDHDGFTNKLGGMGSGDHLLIRDPWGTIQYKGKGIFIAGGAGITPFIAILRDLADKGQVEGNSLLFANRTDKDIILRETWEKMPGLDHLFVTSDGSGGFASGRIGKEFLKKHLKDFSQHFYVCGPDAMVADIMAALKELGAKPDALVFEK